jgi:pimeloyl-ACP methyl ester carboxylesterase
MPYLTVNDANLWYEDSGQGQETVVFSHGFLMNHGMFDEQVRSLEDTYRCVRYDHRGQGKSEVAESGYDIESLAGDAARLIRKLDCAPCHFAGLSMGGFVGLRLAIHHPELLRSLTLMETSADAEPKRSRRRYSMMAKFAAWFGFRLLVGPISRIMFGETFMHNPDMRPKLESWQKTVLSADRAGILKAVDGVLDRQGVYGRLRDVTTPTLIIVGDEDRATPLSRAQRMHEAIAGSKLSVIPGAGHSSPIEQPERVTSSLLDFLVGLDAAWVDP